ncbi:SDR family oxidoreductase [Vibrio sp. AK197]|uniref:SDR family oxidoreductase n=1 Tax=Vibrio olivae TaxID=1243002 RepID=A0ABV5HPC1_9VIBR
MKIIVTGATSGIGYELSKALTAKGHQVFATGRNQTKLQALKEETGCLVGDADLADAQQTVDIFHTGVKALGGLDVLINNAGMNSRKCTIEAFTNEEFDLQYAINLRAPAILCREAVKVMKPAGHGHIFNVVSTVAKRASETMGVYTAMKQGLSGLNDVLMKEVQPHGIKVTALYPGGTDTNFREAERPQYMQPQSVAETITTLLELPSDVIIHELLFRPQVELE